MALITIGELIDRSWEHYRREFVDLMSISGWFLVVAIMDIVALALYPSASKMLAASSLSPAETVGVALYGFSNWILTPLIGLWVFISLVRLVRAHLSGRRGGVREAMIDGKRYFLPTLAISVLMFLLMASIVLIGFGPSAVLSLLAAMANNDLLSVLASAMLVVGVVAAVFLAFRWSVHYYFAPFTLLMDDTRGLPAFRESRKLVSGRYWGVLLRLIIPKIVFALLGAFLMAIIAFVLSIASSALVGLNLDVQLRLSTISTSVISTIIAVLLNPLIVIADLLLYQSLKGR